MCLVSFAGAELLVVIRTLILTSVLRLQALAATMPSRQFTLLKAQLVSEESETA